MYVVSRTSIHRPGHAYGICVFIYLYVYLYMCVDIPAGASVQYDVRLLSINGVAEIR